MKKIVLFNHKGGVGKTITTANLALALAAQGKRVLLVDTDPQCNLSSYFLEDQKFDVLLDSSDSDDGTTVWSAVRRIVEGDSNDVTVVAPVKIRDNLWLVPGDIRLAEYEEELTSLWGECLKRKLRGFKGTSALSILSGKIAESLSIDFVFYDCGPNIGPLNRVLVLDSDLLIIPAACDLFSIRAIRSLEQTLQRWLNDWETIAGLAPATFPLLTSSVTLAGYLAIKFRTYAGAPAATFIRQISEIEKAVTNGPARVLRLEDEAPRSWAMKLGEIKDLSGLAATAQKEHVAVWETSAGNQNQRDEAKGIFVEVAGELIRRAQS